VSLDDRIRQGLPGLVAGLEDPEGSAQKVLASSRMRFRRRRTFAMLGTMVLFAGGAVLAVAERDDAPPTEVLSIAITAPTTSTVSSSTAAVPSPAPAPTTVVVATGARGALCRVPLLVTKLPADYLTPLVATDDGSWLVRGAAGHTLAIASGSAAITKAAGVASHVVDVPALATKAEMSARTDGSLLATLAPADARCGPSVSLVAQGMTDAELAAVLGGLRNETDCSSKGFLSTPASQGTDLPAAVSATRSKVRADALACDFDGLAALARTNPAFAAEEQGVDLADQWRFADARGTQFMRAVVGLLDLVPRRSDVSIRAGSTSWVWPWFAFDDPTTKLVDADFATLDRVFGAGYGARFRSDYRKTIFHELAETYLGGLFVEIRADGTLAAITTR
jgi:hypothetical protein